MCSHFSVSGSKRQRELDGINKHTDGFFLHDFIILSLLKIKFFEEPGLYLQVSIITESHSLYK